MRMPLYICILIIGLAGLFQAPWWAAVVGGCVLALMFLVEDGRLAHRARVVEIAEAHILSSLLIATLASPIAFGAGRITATVWGL